MKTISIFLALINALLAGLLLAYNLSSSELYESNTLWMFAKSFAALSVIGIGILTWLASVGAINNNPLLVSGLYLVVLGAVTIVWTYHLAVLRGGMEYYMVVFGASLSVQGIASLLGFGAMTQSMTVP